MLLARRTLLNCGGCCVLVPAVLLMEGECTWRAAWRLWSGRWERTGRHSSERSERERYNVILAQNLLSFKLGQYFI